MSIFGVVTLIFIVLKFLDLIDWSWWLVFSPAFVGFGVVLLLTIIGYLFAEYRSGSRWRL